MQNLTIPVPILKYCSTAPGAPSAILFCNTAIIQCATKMPTLAKCAGALCSVGEGRWQIDLFSMNYSGDEIENVDNVGQIDIWTSSKAGMCVCTFDLVIKRDFLRSAPSPGSLHA